VFGVFTAPDESQLATTMDQVMEYAATPEGVILTRGFHPVPEGGTS